MFFPKVIKCQGHSLGWGWQLAWRRGRKTNKGSSRSSVVQQIHTIGSWWPSSIIWSSARVSCWRLIGEQMGLFCPGCWYSRGSQVWLKRGCCFWGGSGDCRSSCTSCGRRRCWRGASNKISCLNQTISTLVKNILGRRIYQKVIWSTVTQGTNWRENVTKWDQQALRRHNGLVTRPCVSDNAWSKKFNLNCPYSIKSALLLQISNAAEGSFQFNSYTGYK